MNEKTAWYLGHREKIALTMPWEDETDWVAPAALGGGAVSTAGGFAANNIANSDDQYAWRRNVDAFGAESKAQKYDFDARLSEKRLKSFEPFSATQPQAYERARVALENNRNAANAWRELADSATRESSDIARRAARGRVLGGAGILGGLGLGAYGLSRLFGDD